MDRLTQMQAYISVATEGSFTAAAQALDLSPQLVSKYVAALEAQLGLRLLNRTTRKVHMTEAGERYLREAAELLERLNQLESNISQMQQAPQGLLRVSAPVALANRFLAEAVQSYQQLNPRVTCDIQLNDRRVDIVEEGFDLALRIGELQSSSLIARRLADTRVIYCASPDYIEHQGVPQRQSDMKHHRMLHYSLLQRDEYGSAGAGLSSNSGDFLTAAALAGAGIVAVPQFMCGEYLAQGRLVEVLQQEPRKILGLYAVYPHRALLPLKVRSFVEHLLDFFVDRPL